MAGRNFSRQAMSYSWAIVAGVLMASGIGCLLLATRFDPKAYPVANSVFINLGGVIFATGMISILWELIARRTFLSEVFSIAQLSEEIKASGLSRATMNFQHDLEWPKLLRNAKEMDVFVAYARTWRHTNSDQLAAFAKRPGSRMRLIMPDPGDEVVVAGMAARFGYRPSEVVAAIRESHDKFIEMFEGDGCKGHLEIWYTNRQPVLSFYKIDGTYVIASYRHRESRGEILTFVCDRAGTFTEFVDKELEYLKDAGRPGVRKVYPAPKQLEGPKSK